ncbi:MAG: malate/lactate/ureidoglycolate dehydrogenase [Geminicoccaceae bacterium]|nr:malate/lactate/ureidoglycolate dehydrogenase [Geminicoccaceae bacterium]
MLVQVAPLRTLITAIFVEAGCPDDEAERIAYFLSKANLTGHDSHGVIRVPRYVEWLGTGRVRAGQHVETLVDTPAITLLDGKHGFGQTVGPEACRIGIDKALANGVAVVALRNAGHLGRIGDFAESAVEAGLVSIHFVNVHSSLLVAPFGGADRRTSTNPIAIGVPTSDGKPFILDFATSMVAEGKVLVARQGGKPVPGDALISPEGRMTNDPDVLYGPGPDPGSPDPTKGPGAMRTFGEHKGSGLSLACDLLAGALGGSGANCGEVGLFHNGMLSIYLDPKMFGGEQQLRDEAQRYVDYMRSSRPADPAAPVMVPGDKERKLEAERTRDGIPLPDHTWNAILGAARSAGLSDTRIDELLGKAA